MHTNKSTALSQPLGPLMPNANTAKQRNAGMEPAASFASLYKSSREAAPANPPIAPPAPTPAPTASVAAPKPAASNKPAATQRQAAAEGAAAQRGDADAPAAATDGKSQPAASSTAGRQACAAAKAAEADQRDASNSGIDTQLLQLAASALTSDERDDTAGDALETAADNSKDDAPDAGTNPIVQSAGAPQPPVLPVAHPDMQPPARRSEAGADERADERVDSSAAAAGDERRIERSNDRGRARPTELPQDAAIGAASASTERSAAAAADIGSALPHTELAVAPTAGSDVASASSRQAGPEGGPPTAGFQQAMNQALSQIQGSTAADPGGAVADTRMLPIRHELHGPGFAPEMGAQLSLLAREGVQSAQLLLNPAEMGPVAVQIVLDGQQAQISFHSDLAETRAVLERSLPDLAAALRENGLTLSGGGVFQQDAGTRQQQQADGARQARDQARGTLHGGAGDHAPIPAAPRRAGAARGVLDTYA